MKNTANSAAGQTTGTQAGFSRLAPAKLLSFLRQVPVIPGLILAIFLICGVAGPYIAPHPPNEVHLADTLTPPVWQEGGSATYLLGTDHLGRDILSRLVEGAALSLQVGFSVVAFAGCMGIAAGLLSGYLGGWTDTVIMRFCDIILSMPYLMLAIVLAAVLGPSRLNIVLILAVLGWASYARVLRSEVLRLKGADFIHLAVLTGCSRTRVMLRHILPNIINTFVVMATLQIGNVIIAEASLSFLGLGVPPPDPAWGSMAAEGREYIFDAWWLCVWPGLIILLVVLSCNLLGDWLRVRLDPKFRQL
ncbi:MAG: ABC transporter permease [Desulfarculaceae bacterium]